MIHSKTIKLLLLLITILAVVIVMMVLLTNFEKATVGDTEQNETLVIGDAEKNEISVDKVGLLDNDVVRNFPNKDLEQAASYLDSALWVPLPGGDTETSVVNNSILICEGTVVDSFTMLYGDEGSKSLWFTQNKVSVKKVQGVALPEASRISLRSKNDDMIIDVIQTGAILEDGSMANVIKDAPLLEKGKTYVLFLSAYDGERYIPVGGRLGIAESTGGVLRFTNGDAAKMMSSFEGKSENDITHNLKSLSDKIESDDIIINTENTAPLDFISDIKKLSNG